MALQPGVRSLTPVSVEGGSAPPRLPRRETIADPNTGRQPDLRPTSRAVREVGMGPQPAQGDNEFIQLARGLASLNPALNQLAGVLDDKDRLEQEDAAAGRIGRMTFDEAREAVRRGDLPEFANPWFQAAFQRQFAQRHAFWRADRLMEDYNTSFDRQSGNLDEFIRSRVSEDLNEFGGNPHFTRAYTDIMERAGQRLRAHDSEMRNRETREAVNDNFVNLTLRAAQEGLAANRSPQEILTAIRSQYAGNQQFLNMTLRQQDEGLMVVAQRLAEEGHYDLVRHILTDDRGGVGALGGGGRAVTAQRLIELAERNRDQLARRAGYEDAINFNNLADAGQLNDAEFEEWRRQNPGRIPDSQAAALRYRNREARQAAERNLATVAIREAVSESRRAQVNADAGLLAAGNIMLLNRPARVMSEEDVRLGREPSVEISAETRRTAAINAYLEESDRVAAENQETPEQRFNREAEVFTRNGAVNPRWAQALSTGFAAASLATLNDGQEPPQVLQAGLALYRQLRAKAPNLLAMHITDRRAHDFFDGVRVAQENLGMAEGPAMRAALLATSDPARRDDPMVSFNRQDVERQIGTLSASATLPRWFPFSGTSTNQSEVGRFLHDTAEFYVRMGMTSQQALEAAGERARTAFTPINGRQVQLHGRSIMPNFPELVQRRLDAFVRENPGGDHRPGDLSIAAGNGDGAWVIVDRITGLPVRGRGSLFNDDTLRAEEAQRQREVAEQLSNEANRRRSPVPEGRAPGRPAPQPEVDMFVPPRLNMGSGTPADRRTPPTPTLTPEQRALRDRNARGELGQRAREDFSNRTGQPAPGPVVPPPRGANTTQQDLLRELERARRE